MMSATHPFVTYNKLGTPKTLVGNWQEESALAETAGHHRYARWTAGLEHSASEAHLYPLRCAPTNDDSVASAARTVQHSERPDEWHTSVQAVHGSNVSEKERIAREKSVHGADNVGVRTARKREELLQQAKEDVKQSEPQPEVHELTTTLREEHTDPGPPLMTPGRRSMKTQDGEDVPLSNRDEKLLAEQGMPDRTLELAKQSSADVESSSPLPPSEASKHYSQARGTTIHSQRLQEGKQPEQSTLPASGEVAGAAGTFGRNSSFTRYMNDPL